MNCYKCDTELMNNWNYCPNCKRKIKKNKKVNEEEFISCTDVGKCHKCSCELNDKWNFCPVCGTSAEFYSNKPYMSVPVMAASGEVVTGNIDRKEDTKEENEVHEEIVEQKEAVGDVTMNEKENVVLYNDEVLCPKCGAIGTEAHLFCSVCGAPMKQETINKTDGNTMGQGTVYVTSSNNNPVPNGNTEDKGYIPWIWASYLGAPCGFLLSFMSGIYLILGGLVSLGSAIYAKTKYPNVPIVKFTFWFILILYTLSIIAFLIMIYLIAAACASCANELN